MLPFKTHTIPFEEVCKISRDYAVTAIQTLGGKPSSSSGESDRPFRFIYVSGLLVNRDRAELEKNQMLVERGMVEYCAMRVCFPLSLFFSPLLLTSPSSPPPLLSFVFCPLLPFSSQMIPNRLFSLYSFLTAKYLTPRPPTYHFSTSG